MCQIGARESTNPAEAEMQIPTQVTWDEGMEQILRAKFAGDEHMAALRIDMKSTELLVLDSTQAWANLQGPPSCVGLPLAEVFSKDAFGHVKSCLQECSDDFVDKCVDLVASKTYELDTFYFCSPDGKQFCAMVALTLSGKQQRLGSGEIELYLKDVELIGSSEVPMEAAVELWTKRPRRLLTL